jgi:hypothetical protein
LNTSAEKQALIDAASACGFKVTPKQIDRWRADKLLPPPARTSAGRGRGVQRPAPEGSAHQLIRLCGLLREDRSLHRAAFRLWVEAFPVPLERTRKALRRLALDPMRLIDMAPEKLSGAAETYADNVRTRKSTPARVKKMADEGRLSTLLESMLAMGLGRPLDPKDEATFGATFEEYAGLERARTDHWEGQSPWLTGDTSRQVKAMITLLPRLRSNLADDATDEDFEKTRLAFSSWEKMRRCTELLEQLHGPNAFGLGMLTRSPIDVRPSKTEPMVFMGLLAFYQQEPGLIDNMIIAGETLDTALDGLREKVENATRKTTEH